MNVLHVVSAPASGGAEVYVRDLAVALKSKGINVVIGFVNRAEEIGRCIKYESEYLMHLDNGGIPYFFLPGAKKKNLIAGRTCLKKNIIKFDIEICHFHLLYPVFYSIFLSVPIVYTYHSDAPKSSEMLYRLFVNRIVDQYVGISHVCSSNLKLVTGRSVTTIFNGVNAKGLHKRLRSVRNRKTLKFIAVGRLIELKNYSLMIEAFANLKDSLKDLVDLRIVGEGNEIERNKLIELVKAHDLEDQVYFLGNRGDVAELLDSSDIFLMSSKKEGLPISLIEASLSGLPVIVTDVGGCSEIVDVFRNGMVVPSDNVSYFTSALDQLIRNRNLLESFSKNAMLRSEFFDIDRACDDHAKLYKGIL